MENRIKKLLNLTFIGFIFLPLVLILIDGQLRTSISNYAYSKYSYIFVSFLTFAGSMLIIDGCKDDKITKNKWYSIIIGLSLIGVSLTPHLDYPKIHYTFASIFFIGSTMSMVIFSSKKQRKFKLYLVGVILIPLILHFTHGWYNLLIGEWVAFLPIIINYLGENNGKLD